MFFQITSSANVPNSCWLCFCDKTWSSQKLTCHITPWGKYLLVQHSQYVYRHPIKLSLTNPANSPTELKENRTRTRTQLECSFAPIYISVNSRWLRRHRSLSTFSNHAYSATDYILWSVTWLLDVSSLTVNRNRQSQTRRQVGKHTLVVS